jgi:amidohydrolase
MTAAAILPKELGQMIEWRRALHENPEVSGAEYHTRDFILQKLHELNIPTKTFDGHMGILATIEGKGPGGVVALRADMDALPITESNNLPHCSRNEGVMHACGHDGHMSMLLGAATALKENRNAWRGTIKLVFQPSEEAAPKGGSPLMIADGILENPKVDMMFGMHLWPDLHYGDIGICRGTMMASSDRFTLKLFGAGAHAGAPHQGIDAVMMTSDVLTALSRIIHRQTDPRETATINIGTMHGGERYNVVAKEVVLEGTVRTLNETVRQDIPARMRRMIQGVCDGYGGRYELDYQFGYPSLQNAPDETGFVILAASRFLGAEHVQSDHKPVLGAEDFAFFAEKVPAAYFFVGCGSPGAPVRPLHSGGFDFDERSLFVGAQVMEETALAALTFLERKNKNEGGI